MAGLCLLQTEQGDLAKLWVCVGLQRVRVCVCVHARAHRKAAV